MISQSISHSPVWTSSLRLFRWVLPVVLLVEMRLCSCGVPCGLFLLFTIVVNVQGGMDLLIKFGVIPCEAGFTWPHSLQLVHHDPDGPSGILTGNCC
jgi:hypothetical protein